MIHIYGEQSQYKTMMTYWKEHVEVWNTPLSLHPEVILFLLPEQKNGYIGLGIYMAVLKQLDKLSNKKDKETGEPTPDAVIGEKYFMKIYSSLENTSHQLHTIMVNHLMSVSKYDIWRDR